MSPVLLLLLSFPRSLFVQDNDFQGYLMLQKIVFDLAKPWTLNKTQALELVFNRVEWDIVDRENRMHVLEMEKWINIWIIEF